MGYTVADPSGAVGSATVEITLEPLPEPDPDPVCDTVEVFDAIQLLNRNGHDSATTVIGGLPCSKYRAVLVSTDPGHRSGGYQTEQTNEQWVLEGLDDNGEAVYSSDPTPDLADELTTNMRTTGPIDTTAIKSWRIRHTRTGHNINSIHATVTLEPLPEPDPDPVCDTVEVFDAIQLLNRNGHDSATTVIGGLPCSKYRAVLVSTDPGHRSGGYQTEQTNEQWVLEGLDDNGEAVYSSDPTPDLADELTTNMRTTGPIDTTAIKSWRIRHTRTGHNINSIHATVTLEPLQ